MGRRRQRRSAGTPGLAPGLLEASAGVADVDICELVARANYPGSAPRNLIINGPISCETNEQTHNVERVNQRERERESAPESVCSRRKSLLLGNKVIFPRNDGALWSQQRERQKE